MSVPRETERRLWRWGGWASGGLEFFRMTCALSRINAGSRATADSEADPEIIRTNVIIGRSERRHRLILIRQYCTRGTIREKAGRIRLPKSSYYDLLEEARWYVHTEYDKPDLALGGQQEYKPYSVRIAVTHPLTGDT